MHYNILPLFLNKQIDLFLQIFFIILKKNARLLT